MDAIFSNIFPTNISSMMLIRTSKLASIDVDNGLPAMHDDLVVFCLRLVIKGRSDVRSATVNRRDCVERFKDMLDAHNRRMVVGSHRVVQVEC